MSRFSIVNTSALVTALSLTTASAFVLAEGTSRRIEEVIVTAERQEASIQDTSISITAFTGEMIDDFGIRNQEDLQNFVPATTIQPYDATVRGVGRNFRALGGDPGVATYMNEVYSEDLLTATAATFWDVERIEVLRGPQGTLYGRNAVGGAINILYKEPAHDFDYAIRGIVGNFGTAEYYGMINGSIIDDVLAARVNFSVRDRDGVVEEIGGGRDLDGLGTENIALQLNWTPNDAFEVNMRVNKMDIDRPFGGANGGGLVILSEQGLPGRNTTDLVPGLRFIDRNNTDPANRDQSNWFDTTRPVQQFAHPVTGVLNDVQPNRPGLDVADFDGFQNAAASLDGFNQTSAESAAAYNECVFSGDISGDDLCGSTNGLNREEFNQQGVQLGFTWDISDTMRAKYLYGYNKLSYQRTTDDDNTASQFHDRQFYVNHEAKYESHELQLFWELADNLTFTSGIFFYDALIDQRGDFYSSVGESRFINGYVDNTGLAGAFFGNGATATLHSAKARCEVANPAPSCAVNYAVNNSPAANGLANNNLHLAQWYGDDGTLPDLDVEHGINSLGSDLLYHTQTDREAFAAYTQGVWDINDTFTLTFGIRYAEDETTAEENLFRYSEAAGAVVASIVGSLGAYNRANGGLVADPTAPNGERATELAVNGGIPISLSVYRPFNRTDKKVTGRINLDWNVNDDTLMYFSATSGYRSGGYNLVFFSQSPTYEPEELLAYEIGYKGQFSDGTVQLNGSVYYYDYETIHTVATEVSTIGGLTTSTLEAPGAEIFGVEAELLWLASDRLTLGGNFSFTPSEYTEDLFINDPSDTSTPESLFAGSALERNINGNQVLQVPELKYSAFASYLFNLGNGSNIEVLGSYSWIDEVFYSPFEADTEVAESYDRADIRATWTSPSEHWVVSGFVNNIFDDVGVLQVLRNDESEFFRQSAGTTVPRLYGLEVTYSLGVN